MQTVLPAIPVVSEQRMCEEEDSERHSAQAVQFSFSACALQLLYAQDLVSFAVSLRYIFCLLVRVASGDAIACCNDNLGPCDVAGRGRHTAHE